MVEDVVWGRCGWRRLHDTTPESPRCRWSGVAGAISQDLAPLGGEGGRAHVLTVHTLNTNHATRLSVLAALFRYPVGPTLSVACELAADSESGNPAAASSLRSN